MLDIPEDEARQILHSDLRCEDTLDWTVTKVPVGTYRIATGIVNSLGQGVNLLLQLDFSRSSKTKIVRYQFSVFKRQRYGLERVYQLEVNQYPRPLKDLHKRSHEHIGNVRIVGDASWADWRYDEVITYFCAQTGIVFDPTVPHPENFSLRPSP